MTMSATLQIVGNPIMGQPSTCVLVVSNSSGAGVNVTGIQPKCSPIGSPVMLSSVVASPGQSVAGTTGTNSFSVQVPAGGSTTFTFSAVAFSGAVATGQKQQGSENYYLSADIICSDGSEISPVAQEYSPANPQFGYPPEAPPDVSGVGELQFNNPSNSAWAL